MAHMTRTADRGLQGGRNVSKPGRAAPEGRRANLAGSLLFLVAVLCGSALSAAVFRVDGLAGSDGAGCGSEISPCATIQQAIGLASSGDTILVSEAVYTDNESCSGSTAVVCVFQKELTILGGFSSGNWSLPDPSTHTTVIDGQDARRGVIVRRGGPSAGLPATSLRMEGFTIRRGEAVGSPHGFGGGLQANFADIVLRDMIFEDNVALGGSGGLAGGGGVAIQAGSGNTMNVTLERILFRDNQVTGGGGTGEVAQGGGLIIDHAVVAGSNLDFQNNFVLGGASATDGRDALGGAASFTFGTTGTLQNVTATGNTATGGSASNLSGAAFGGAIFLEGAESPAADVTELSILDARVTSNTALGGNASTARGGVGGAIAVFGARLTLERSALIGNLAEGGTGASAKGNAGGGGLFLEWPFSSTGPMNVVRNSILADNVMEGSQGGGVGLRLLGARATVVHSTFVDNRIVGAGFGSGILVGPRLTRPSALTISYSILADHTVPSGARTLHVQLTPNAGSTATFAARNLFVGNSNDTNFGEASSGTFVGFPGANLFDSNPSTFFVNPATSNYHIDGTQPPTNSASGSSESLDFDGATRSGTRDLGADEVGTAAFGLSVAKWGVGDGTVTSSPSGIACGSDCFQIFDDATVVSLNANPAPGSFFTGWSGDADCSDGSVLMNQSRECTAQFEDNPPMCTVEDDNLVLTGQTVNSTVVESACNSITAGPSYTVGQSGTVTFEAPTIVLRSGFVVRGDFVAVSKIP